MVKDNLLPGAVVLPRLNATHLQGLPFNFTGLNPSDTFDVREDGTIYVVDGATLDSKVQDTYALSFDLEDTQGLTSSYTVTIFCEEVNYPPAFTSDFGNGTIFYFSIDDGSPAGTVADAVGDGADRITAVDPNAKDTLIFRALRFWPPQAKSYISLDPLGGELSVAGAVREFIFDQSWVLPQPFTVAINVSVLDSGSPQLWHNATAFVTIARIRPKMTGGEVDLPQSAPQGAIVGRATCTTPYRNGIVRYSMAYNDYDSSGNEVFAINPTTGNISMAVPAGNLNFNVKARYNASASCIDINNRTASAVFFFNLAHVNRPPTWTAVPRFYAASQVSGNIGTALSAFVIDPDASMPTVRELLTFDITAGNTDSTFGIDRFTGQIFVAKNNTPSFIYPGSPPPTPPVYNLTVRVQDAGVDGPVYSSVYAGLIIELTPNAIPPSIGYYNLTIPEFSAAGLDIAIVAGSSFNGYQLSYRFVGAGIFAYFTFPFSIRTNCSLPARYPSCFGIISYTGAVTLEYYQGFQQYLGILAVTDTNPNGALTSSSPVDIYVTYRPVEPFFNRVLEPQDSAFFSLEFPEHAPGGYQCTPVEGALPAPFPGMTAMRGEVQAKSKDPWQMDGQLLRLAWASSSRFRSLFVIEPIDGNITLSNTAGDIVYDISRTVPQNNFTLRVQATDANRKNGTALVVVYIRDVNDPAAITGVKYPNGTGINFARGDPLVIKEDAPTGAQVGYITAFDPDAPGTPASAQIWSLVGDPEDGDFFDILANGTIVVAANANLQFLDQPVFKLTATARDALPDEDSQSVSVNITIRLAQVNRVKVNSFGIPLWESPANTANLTDRAPGNNAEVAYTTAGGGAVLIYGQAFGPTARRLAALGLNNPATASVITASYGPTGYEYNASSCYVSAPFSEVTCVTTAGVGTNHRWVVTVDGGRGGRATSTHVTGYMPPSIDAVWRAGAMDATVNDATQYLDVAGTDSVFIDVSNAGGRANGDPIPVIRYSKPVVYGAALPLVYTCPRCTWLVPGSRLQCTTAPGVGANLTWTASTTGQTSPAHNMSYVRYKPPAITAVAAPPMDTAGADAALDNIVITGAQFGPSNHTDIIVEFGIDLSTPDITGYPVYRAVRCRSSHRNPYREIVCSSSGVQGVGVGLFIRVTVGDAPSPISLDSIRYREPVITGIRGAGADNATTTGGEELIILGEQFGPLTTITAAGTPYGPLQPIFKYGRAGRNPLPYVADICRVVVPHKRIDCRTAQGSGRDLVSQLTIANQPSAVFNKRNMSFGPPVVAAFSGPGARDARTQGSEPIYISGVSRSCSGIISISAAHILCFTPSCCCFYFLRCSPSHDSLSIWQSSFTPPPAAQLRPLRLAHRQRHLRPRRPLRVHRLRLLPGRAALQHHVLHARGRRRGPLLLRGGGRAELRGPQYQLRAAAGVLLLRARRRQRQDGRRPDRGHHGRLLLHPVVPAARHVRLDGHGVRRALLLPAREPHGAALPDGTGHGPQAVLEHHRAGADERPLHQHDELRAARHHRLCAADGHAHAGRHGHRHPGHGLCPEVRGRPCSDQGGRWLAHGRQRPAHRHAQRCDARCPLGRHSGRRHRQPGRRPVDHRAVHADCNSNALGPAGLRELHHHRTAGLRRG